MSRPLQQIFLEHPQSVGESYVEHFQVASTFGLKLMLAGLAAFAHAVFPCLFTKTASNLIVEMHQKVENRGK